MVFVQDRLGSLEAPRYRVLYQTRRRATDHADSRSGSARRRGVLFVRYNPENPPQVEPVDEPVDEPIVPEVPVMPDEPGPGGDFLDAAERLGIEVAVGSNHHPQCHGLKYAI